VAAVAFLVTALSIGQLLWRGNAGDFESGRCWGFLWFNFSPAKIFMGIAGVLLIGLLAGGI